MPPVYRSPATYIRVILYDVTAAAIPLTVDVVAGPSVYCTSDRVSTHYTRTNDDLYPSPPLVAACLAPSCSASQGVTMSAINGTVVQPRRRVQSQTSEQPPGDESPSVGSDNICDSPAPMDVPSASAPNAGGRPSSSRATATRFILGQRRGAK